MTDLERVEVRDLILFHEEVAKKYPQVERGTLNESILESIVMRPFASFGERRLYTDIFEQAACLLEAIIRYHPFVDGNKRTALMATEFFLRRNGYEMFIPDDIPDFLREVAKHEANTEEQIQDQIKAISEWLSGLVAKLPVTSTRRYRLAASQPAKTGLSGPPRFVKNRSRPGYSVYAKNGASGAWVSVKRRDGKTVRLQLGKRLGRNRFRIRRLRR